MVKYSRFKEFLAKNGIKKKDVAKLLDISKSYLSVKLNKKGEDFTFEQVRKLCDVYNLSADEFFLNPKLS